MLIGAVRVLPEVALGDIPALKADVVAKPAFVADVVAVGCSGGGSCRSLGLPGLIRSWEGSGLE
jgi:hypothetical protein